MFLQWNIGYCFLIEFSLTVFLMLRRPATRGFLGGNNRINPVAKESLCFELHVWLKEVSVARNDV